MPLDKGKLQKLYSTLQQGGYTQSYAEFEKGFTGNDNYPNRKKIYDLLTEHGADIGSSYEDFMKKMQTPAASSPAPSYSQQRTQAPAPKPQPKPAPKPKPRPQPKPKGGGMTAAERAQFIRNAQGIVHQSAAGLQRSKNQIDYANSNRGLKVRPVHLGQNSKVVRRHANGTVAKPRPVFDVAPEQQPGDTYLTESGNEFTSRAEADTEQNAVDQYRYDQSETGQLNNAYAEAERLDKLLEQRGKELDEENRDKWWRDLPRGGGGAVSTMNANDNNGRMTDTEYLNLLAARKKVDEQIRDLKAARDEKTGTFLGGLWRGFRDYAFDLSNWDNGYRDLLTTSAMLRAKTGAAQTPREKASERMMMEDTYKAGEAAQKAEKVLGNGYRFMRIGAQSLPFALQFMAGNAMGMTGGIARAGEGMGVKLARKIAIKQGANNMMRNIGRSVLKNTGVMLGDLGAATALTTTIQAGQTGADIGQRYVGDVAYDPKTDDYKLEGGKSLGRSIYEGVANSAIENYTEMLGEHMHLGKFANSALSKVGLGKVSNWFTKVGKTDFMQGVNKYMKMAGFNGYPQEVMEEEVGIPLHAIFDGGNKMSDLLDGRQQLDIVGGMLFSMAGMGGASMVMQGGHKAAMAVQYHQDQHKLDNADKVASFRLTADKWAPIKDEIDGTTNEDFGKVMKGVLSNDELSDQEKQAVWDYAQRLVIMRGHNMGQEAATRNGMTDKETNTANESYTQGYNTTDATAMNDAKNRLAAAQQKFDEYMEKTGREHLEGEPSMQDIQHRHRDAQSILSDKWADGTPVYNENDEEYKLAQAVVNAQQEYEGMMQRVRDDIDDEVQQTGSIYDSRTNDQGVIQSATLKAQNPDGTDKKVYITSGNVVMTDDGKSVDNQKSDMSIVVVDEDGKVQMISPEDIFSLDTPIDGAQAKQQALDAIQQSKAQEAADKINGKVDLTAGSTYTLTDNTGQQIEATIVADGQTGAVQNPDGTINVSMNGKVVPMDVNTLQQMVDNTNMQRTAQSDEEDTAEEAAAQQQPTEPDNTEQTGDEGGTVTPEGAAVPTYPGSVVAPDVQEPHQWQVDDTFTIDNDGVPVRGQVSGVGEDGVEIYTESPVNGKKMQVVSPAELQSMTTEINGEAVEAPEDEAAAEQQPTEPSPTEQNAGNVTDGVNGSNGVNGEQAQEQATQAQEQAQPQQTEGQPARAIDRIPSQQVDDGKGNVRTVHNWEQAEPGDTYDALTEIYHGNAERVKKGIDNRVGKIDKAIKGVQKQMDAIDNSDDFDEVAAQSDQYDQLQQQKDELEKQKKYWQGVQMVPRNRKMDADRRTAEEAAAAKAAQEKAEAEAAEKARQEREQVNGVPDVVNDIPSDARKRGFRNVNGMVVSRQGETQGVTGRESNVKFSSTDTDKGHIKVIDADQLQPSHVSGQRNPSFFIDEAQPKDRTDTVSSMAAAKIASNLNPEEITGDGSAYQFSAPTVNSRGEVIQGNNRSDALKLMYSTPAFKPAQDAYKQYIADHAEEFGFTPEDVEKIQQMEHPVMVNELDVPDDEAIRLGQMKASDNESGGIERIDPVTTSQKLGGKVSSFANVLLSSPDEDASLSDVLMQNGAKAVKWLRTRGAISDTAAQSAFDKKGNLTPEARMDLQNILKQSLFQGGVSDLPTMFDKLPAKAQKAILNTFMRDFDSAESERILPEIQKAIEAWYGCANASEAFAKAPNYKGAKVAMHEWTLQTNLLDDNMPSDKFSNFAMELACRMQGCSMRETQQNLNDFFDLVQGKSQGDLFGGTTMGEQADRQESIRRIFNIEYKPISNNNGKTGSNAVADNGSQSGEGRQGSPTDGKGRERAESGSGAANGAGGTESHDEEGIDKGAVRTTDGGYSKLPTNYAYRITDAQELQDVLDNGMFRKMPDDKIVPGSVKTITSKSGRTFSFGKHHGNSHGGKAFAAGMPWGDNGNGGTTSGGFSGERYYIAIPGNNVDGWRVGHHGHYSEPQPFDKIEAGKGLWLPFDEDGEVDLSTKGMRVFRKVGDTYYEVEHQEELFKDRKAAAEQRPTEPSEDSSHSIGATSSSDKKETERQGVNTEPSEKQKEAGNYKKGHIKVDGYDITIENPKGSTRSGKDASGKAWSVPMHYDYGYIKGTEGVDGDHIDVYLSDNPTSGNVYVVDQIDQKTGKFDEHKVMYGFPSKEAAVEAYKTQYEKGWKVGPVTEVSREDFKKWVESSKRKTKPFSEYKSVKEAAAMQQPTQQSNDSHIPFPKGSSYELKGGTVATIKDIIDKDHRLVSFDAPGREDSVISVSMLQEVLGTNEKEANEQPVRYGSRGYTLRPARQEDFEGHTQFYVDGKQVHAVMLVRTGEQVSATQFSAPRVEAIYTTTNERVPVEKLEVEDVPTTVHLKSVGDFYETNGNDAVALGHATGVTVTQREGGMKMAGFPKSALKDYEQDMLDGGFNVAIDGKLTAKSIEAEKAAAKSDEAQSTTANIVKQMRGATKSNTSTNAIKNAMRGKKTEGKKNNDKKKAVSSQQKQPSFFGSLFGDEESSETNQRPAELDLFSEQQKPAVISTDDEKGKEKPIETKPAEELSGNSKEYQERAKAEQEFVERIKGMITEAANDGRSLTMSDIKKAYNDELDGNWELKDDYSDTDLQELVERAMTLATREVAIERISKNTPEAVREGYDMIVKLYEAQPSLNARDSTRVAHQQYSTPTPFGYLMDWFLRNGRNPYKGLEPSAGNGALTIGFPAVLWHVNDIDERRLMNLRTMPYGTITNQDGTMPFEPKAYDMVATNPPFGSTQEKEFDGGRTKISSLEGLMAINALASMKDDGRAAIIIGGNTQYMTNGAMQAKDMKLFKHLYTHYNVVDVINLDGDMYKRNGTGYNVRMILIAGRKTDVSDNPEKFTFPPVKKKARAEQVKTFDELYKRVEDDIQSAKQMERESPVAVNSDGSHTVNSASERTGNSETAGGVQQQPVRAGEMERRPQSGRNVRPSSAQDGRGNGERGQHGSADRLDHADGRDAGSNHAVQGNGPTQGQSRERREGGSTGRGTVGGTERGRAAQRDNANGGRLAVTSNSAAAQPRPTEPSAPHEKVELGQEKVAYPNKSQSMTLQSRVPAAQAEAIAENLDKLGDVDEMVRSELGYSSKDELYSHLAAEQIDSVALAINQMKHGKGFIIGDMTGVGKGRQGAALIRWAIKQGKTPIYFTQKARLYTDNYRDMCDIGSKGLHPFLIASNDDGNIVENVVDENGEKVYDKNGEPVTRVVYGLPKPKECERVYNYIFQNGKLPPEYDYVLVTYSQIQSGTKTYEIGKNGEIEVKDKSYKGKKPTGADTNGDVRRDVLEKLAKDNYVFLDESHTVGGQSSSGLYMQDMLKGAEGVTYLSATFAKRPDNMPLYAMKTAMSESGLSQKDMIDAIQNGGVTLQEIMSKQLVQSGQMIRRERDFSGVSIDWEGVDEETDKQQRAQFDEVAKIFNAIREFQDNYVDPSIEKMSEDMAEEGKFSKKTQGTSHMGVNNVPFASKMYNLVNQLLFSLKANAVADKAIECLKKGEKPVISFNNTMEGFLDDMPRNTPMKDLPNFSLTLMRALEGTLRYTEGEVGNKDNQVNKTLNLSDLGDEAVAKYNEIRKTILNLSIGLPIDPMDAIKMRIEAAGYKVGEITGRKSEMVKDADGNYIVQSRSSKEMDGKAAASAFNSASGKNGGLDVLLINKSGSTGISLHASSKFTDQSPRVMIAAQFQSDINDEVQMRGRIDRTGQVHRGRYIYLVSSIPAEQRLQMMFKNKLKSLDANTTSSQKSKFNEMEVTDFMNKYGDEVTWSYMMEHPDLEERLGDPLDMLSDESKKSNRRGGDEENNQNSGCAGKILRRLPFLSVKEQEQIFNDLADAYKVKMQILNDAGENDLEITTMPLRAETKSRKVWKEGSDPGSDNAFSDNTYLETAEVDVLKKPMKAKEVREHADRLTDGKPWEQWHQEQHEAVEKFYADKAKAVEDKAKAEAQKRIDKAREDYIKGCLKARKKGDNKWSDEEISHMADIAAREAAEKEQTKINNRYISIDAQRNDVLGALDAFTPLEPLIIPLNLKDAGTTIIPSLGTFIGIKFGKGYSRSSSTAVFATLDGRRKIEVPLSDKTSLENIKHQSVMLGYQARGLSMDNWDSKVPTKSRKTAYIVTGNLMQALVDTQKSPETKGQLISYTTIDGDVKQGILMNDRFKEEDLKTSVPISSMLQKIIDGDTVESADKEVKIERGMSYHYNDFKLSVPKSKSRGGKYFLDKKLLRLLDDEFTTSGSNMTAWVSQQNLKKVLDYLSKTLGVTVQVKANLEETADSPHNDEPSTPAEAEEGGVLYREVDDEEAARLDSEPTVKVYRAMQEHDGKLYPPMSGRVKTQVETKKGTMRTKWVWRSPIEIGKWEQSEEHQEMANEDGTFTLDKGNGSTINAAYNPYIHTSRTPINDQFSSAWNRPELVTVEVEVPVSELTSGYHAEKAKDATGEVEWKSGPVGREMAAQGNPRMVILSRWDKPVRIVPVDEVADEYAVRLAGTGIKVPFNTVPPALREALVARGVEISEPEKGNAGQASRPSYEEWLKGNTRHREGSGAYSDEELSLMNDPVAKWLGKSNRTKAQQKAFANRERKSMVSAAKELADRLHLDNVNIVTDTSTLKGRKARAKGFYDRNTNEITIVIPNHRDVDDVMQTLLHEGVAHYGLRKMFGSHFDTFLDNVYAAADNDVRRRITELALSKYGGDFRVATEEYLASLAEQTDFERMPETFWQKIKDFFLDMLHAIGFADFADKYDFTLSDNELRYILWRSYENLKEPGRYRSILGEAEDVAKQAELKVGDYSEAAAEPLQTERLTQKEREQKPNPAAMYGSARNSDYAAANDGVREPEAWGKRDMLSRAEQVSHGIDPDLLFRDTIEDDDNTARETYNRMADEAKSRIREAWQDSMINVRNLQQAVLEQRGEKLEDYEDAYNAENRSHGKSRAESEYFTDNLYKPLLKAVDDVAKSAKVSVGDVTEYMMAKHGLERNIVFAKRDADAAYKKAYDEAQGKYDALMNASRAESDPKKADALEKAANKVKFPDYDDIFNYLRMRDYAGLTALTGKTDTLDAENEAKRIVADMESRADTSDLWKKTNDATKWTLDKAYQSGIISKDNYNYVSDMFNYYVPLRGWQEDTAGDLFDYVGSGDKGTAFSPTLHKAKGRRSEADNPIAYIGSMAVSAIVQGNKNKVKQTFLGFVENHPTNLVTVSEMWYRNFGTDTDPDWRDDVPNIPEDATADEVADIVQQHEDMMEQLKDLGKATKKRGRLHLGVPVKKGQALEHHVEVMVNGKKYVLYINGNPRAAQALNGTRQRRTSEHSFESSKIARMGRLLAERYTSLSPSFTVSNALRDLTMAAITTLIKESPAYALRFRLNVAKLGGPARMFTLMKWYKKAAAQQQPTGQMSETEKYFYEFMTEGAETGFTSLKEIDEYKKDMDKMYRNMNQKLLNPKRLFRGLSKGLEYANRCIEDMTRFAIYMASRQSGRNVKRSVNDAKNITLNFNRKGSGEMGNATYRNLQIFVNPAIQSLQNVGKMAKDHPVRFTLLTGSIALIGAAQVFATQLLWSMFGGGDGDDDNWNAVDEYWKLPSWQRRNNLVMWIPGTKKFAMIPLAQEFRVFHGFGETMTTVMEGKSGENPALEVLTQASDLLPLDFAGNNGNPLVNLAPTVTQPLLQVGFNTDFTGRPLYKDNDFNKYEPSFQKAYVGTPSWLIKSSEMINDITGGDDHMQGWWERTKVGKVLNNPAVVDHILKGYYGGMYSFLAQLGGTMYTLGTGNMPDAQEVPVVNRVITSPRETEQGGKQKLPDWYYDLSEENARQQNEFSGYKKDYMKGDADGQKKFNELINSKDFQKWQKVNTYIGAVQQIRTAMNYTKDPNEKAELEKSLAEVLGELKKMKDE